MRLSYCYALLGLEFGAEETEIRRSYLRLARSCHPDKVVAVEKAAATEKFKELSQAYTILIDVCQTRGPPSFTRQSHKYPRGSTPKEQEMRQKPKSPTSKFSPASGHRPTDHHRRSDPHPSVAPDHSMEHRWSKPVISRRTASEVPAENASKRHRRGRTLHRAEDDTRGWNSSREREYSWKLRAEETKLKREEGKGARSGGHAKRRAASAGPARSHQSGEPDEQFASRSERVDSSGDVTADRPTDRVAVKSRWKGALRARSMQGAPVEVGSSESLGYKENRVGGEGGMAQSTEMWAEELHSVSGPSPVSGPPRRPPTVEVAQLRPQWVDDGSSSERKILKNASSYRTTDSAHEEDENQQILASFEHKSRTSPGTAEVNLEWRSTAYDFVDAEETFSAAVKDETEGALRSDLGDVVTDSRGSNDANPYRRPWWRWTPSIDSGSESTDTRRFAPSTSVTSSSADWPTSTSSSGNMGFSEDRSHEAMGGQKSPENLDNRQETEDVPSSLKNTWLRRLFDSELFDSRMCLSYLTKHANDPEIMTYISSHVLARYPSEEIEFLLPQLLHLFLVTPESYTSLERFLTERAQHNHHLALMLFWILACYVNDWRDEESQEKLQARKRLSRTIFESASTGTPITEAAVTLSISDTTKPGVLESSHQTTLSLKRKGFLNGDVQHQSELASLNANRNESPEDEDNTGSLISPAYSASRTSNVSRDSAVNTTSPSALRPSLEAFRHGVAFTPLETETSSQNYFNSTIMFFSTMQEISDRLRAVSKESRQAVLVTELEMVNANLPAEVPFMLFLETWDSTDVTSPPASPSVLPTNSIFSNPDANNSTDTFQSEASSDVDEGAENCEECRKLRELEERKGALESMGSTLTPDQCSIGANQTEVKSEAIDQLVDIGSEDPLSEPISTNAESDTESQSNSLGESNLLPLCARHSRRKTKNELKFHTKSDSNRDYYRMVLDRRLRPPSTGNVRRPNSPQPASTASNRTSADMAAEDEISEKMRTAAVLLAQLYQLQEQTIANSPQATSPNIGSPRGFTKRAPDPRTSTSSSRSMYPGAVDFSTIRQKIIREMMTLDDQRRSLLERDKKKERSIIVDEHLEEDAEKKLRAVGKAQVNEPSSVLLHESHAVRSSRIRTSSPYGADQRWRLLSVIVKSGADLRQEQLASQLIFEVRDLWHKYGVACWVKYYRVLVTSEFGGIVETVPDAVSIHSLKKEAYAKRLNQQGLQFTLYDFFVKEFGQPGCESFQKAQENFMRSLAGYSLFCYLFNVKDRHNGNILVDRSGHLIHIDWGFMLSNSPGAVEFERAPFKLLQEYVDILGGYGSATFGHFKQLMFDGLVALRKEPEKFLVLIDGLEKDSTLSCYTGKNVKPSAVGNAPAQAPSRLPQSALGSAAAGVRARLGPQAMTDRQLRIMVDGLVDESLNNVFSRLYDSFQYYSHGIV
ncbi:Phosphatidylinositol 4-kinase pik1alpha (PI4-kinase)(PtdIns-4-kinase) [Gonapodya sp. JEL0774]|nr:Phosphatidylinositol 4-kinase pik1alpha (PI4-kinase)(PtdIns-4-kinase) [Gonapodya sp. JEL0774]